MEIWKDILGYENRYQVSDKGNVRNVRNNIILKGNSIKHGYLQVSLYNKGKRKCYLVHRLVALAFPEICGEYFECSEIDHIDGNPTNNIATNLHFVNHTDNMNNPISLNRRSMSMKGKTHSIETKLKISKSHMKKKIIQFDINGVEIKIWESINQIEKESGFATSNIWFCCNGKYKQAYGFIWKYYDYSS